jgi:hypothetical protein
MEVEVATDDMLYVWKPVWTSRASEGVLHLSQVATGGSVPPSGSSS